MWRGHRKRKEVKLRTDRPEVKTGTCVCLCVWAWGDGPVQEGFPPPLRVVIGKTWGTKDQTLRCPVRTV